MKSETAKSEMNLWRMLSIFASILLLVEVVGMTLLVWKSVFEPSINWWMVALFCVIVLALFSLSVSLCTTAHSNYKTCWRIVEHYEYERNLIEIFKEQRTNCSSVVSHELLNPACNRTAVQKSITAQRADYKLIEMIIETLSDNPSKHICD